MADEFPGGAVVFTVLNLLTGLTAPRRLISFG